MKILTVLFGFMLLFAACSKEDTKGAKQNDIEDSSDVPIAKSDANISIDQNFPPVPVAE